MIALLSFNKPLKVFEWIFILSQKFKRRKDHKKAYMLIYKIFFQLMVIVFKENLNLQLFVIVCSSVMFIFKTAFISEQIAENRFGAL